MRLIVARCEVTYTGRSSTFLPEGIRLLMLKEDGTFLIWSDGGSSKVKPLNSGKWPAYSATLRQPTARRSPTSMPTPTALASASTSQVTS